MGQAIESLGWAAKLGSWAAPLLRWGHLRKESGASFTAAFFSGILANTMLVTLYQEGKISRRELTITYLFNNAMPVYLLHLPTTFFIIFPLTRQAGLIYLGLTLASAVLRSIVLLIYGRLRLPAETAAEEAVAVPAPAKKSQLAQEIWQKFQRRFGRVILFTFPIYILIFVLNDWGLFKWLRDAAASHVSLSFLPMEAASVVIFSVATEFTSGMAAAGAFLQAGSPDGAPDGAGPGPGQHCGHPGAGLAAPTGGQCGHLFAEIGDRTAAVEPGPAAPEPDPGGRALCHLGGGGLREPVGQPPRLSLDRRGRLSYKGTGWKAGATS